VNSNPYAVPALVMLAAMLIAIIAGLAWVSMRPPYEPRHSIKADPRDAADPDGTRYVEALAGGQPAGREPAALPQRDPAPPPGPPRMLPAPADPGAGRLSQVLGALRAWTPQPGSADPTGPLAILGRPGSTPAELASRLAAKHMGGTS
jgi:hypothetical protein